MEAFFAWSSRFATGIDVVDKQHQDLFELINQLHSALQDPQIDLPTIHRIFDNLLQYTDYHFHDEERLMIEAGMEAASLDGHRQGHGLFAQQVELAAKNDDARSRESIQSLLDYLLNWLIFHVLDADQRMAREIAALRSGATPERARLAGQEPVATSVTLLTQSMHALHAAYLNAQQRVFEENQRLEELVAKRTAQLQSENQRMEHLLEQLQHAQMQLLQSEKLATIGQLAAGVAHEINNPIGFVNSNLGSLQQYVTSLLRLIGLYESNELALDTQARAQIDALKRTIELPFLRQDILDLLHESAEGLDRVKKIVQDLKDFARAGESEWQDADLHQGLESTINVAWNEIKYKAEIVREYGVLPLVHCMPAQLNQVFMNLLVNAAQAMREPGVITLRTGVEGERVWVEVEDNGQGMSPEICARVFEPFFTTKPAGQGTGLGLSLSHSIVLRHGGELTVQSTPGVGTCFRISLPVAGPGAEASDA